MYKITEEGSAKIYIAEDKKISKKLPVFYNPVMKLNRDVSVLLLNSITNNDLQIALPLAASGIRGIRFLLELKKNKIKNITFNDYSEEAVDLIKQNLKLNNLKADIENKDANLFLLESSGFDYIDIDPFGSPNPFLLTAITRLSRNGILAVTATDTSALTGTYPGATKRKYFSASLKNEFMHETGIRILIRKIQLTGAENDKALIPIFSYSKDHYYRIFFRCEKGKTKVDDILKQQGYILYCSSCLFRKTSKDIFNKNQCENCGNELDYAGELWLGKLWDNNLVKKMFNTIKNNKELYDLINLIKQESEINAVSFYDIHEICKKYRIKNIPKINDLINKDISRTHFKGEGTRTTLKIKELLKLISS
ncbi:tRNA (guanine(10)-N(2))-dimethyltransferase [Candidatus Woesearchaeota archaeon]|nr:tRNA (guanine(10)-N(2))-dimethyltransferase [Candidatus Woesearchaeota archaeon]